MTAPFTAYLDWDPRWCKDPEELAKPCRYGHVNRGVRPDNARTFCKTCRDDHLAKLKAKR